MAKSHGKGYHAVFEPAMHAEALDRLELEADLRRALKRGELTLRYQPTVALDGGRIVGLEALVRWNHPTRGLLPPAEFIPIAEETGLIVPLGRIVLHQACRQAVAWQGEFPGDPPLSISVNVSGKQLQHPRFVQDVAGALRASGLPPQTLVLEITETVLVQHSEEVMARLEALKELGVQLAIDDFGTEYSSLGYLRRFPIDVLKIDKGFVDGCDQGGPDAALLRTIVKLGRSLGLRTVAEGIEQAGQAAHLEDLACDLGQGFYFAKPLEGPEIAALLADSAQSAGRSPRAA
jgi:EAL domain-containing protein (putative c-di-GMP-specific phosphodiesterase class I)